MEEGGGGVSYRAGLEAGYLFWWGGVVGRREGGNGLGCENL